MSSPRPTASELEILEVLWRIGPATVRQVHEERRAHGGTVGYTTVLKLMQIMAEKGLLQRDTSTRSHVYRPTSPAETTQGALVGDLIDKAFQGSAAQLVLRALSDKPASAEELAEIRALLDALDPEEHR